MGSIYKLEVKSAAKYVDQIDVQSARDHGLPQIVPSSGSPIRQLASYRNPHPPKVRVSESALLDAMKQNVFPDALKRLGYGPALSGEGEVSCYPPVLHDLHDKGRGNTVLWPGDRVVTDHTIPFPRTVEVIGQSSHLTLEFVGDRT